MGGLLAGRRMDADRAVQGSASLDQTLQVFRAILAQREAVDIGDADALVWAYLRPVHGLRAQVDAIEVLRRATVALTAPSAARRSLLDILAGHRRRLNSIHS